MTATKLLISALFATFFSTAAYSVNSNESMVLSQTQEQMKTYEFNMPFNDNSSGLQWYINADREYHYNVKDVWKLNYTGAGIVVAVVDEGLNTAHPDLRRNYDKNASFDFVDGDKNPEPWPNETHTLSGHGSKCAGVIAAEAGNNNTCGVGLAYNARIGGIRLFTTDMALDEKEAAALKFNRDYIDIYSNSWGPGDRGFEVKGPGNATQHALKDGAKEGRQGKGSIFVFASGNGGILSKDSCAYNGYVNSIHTIAISAVNRDGSVPVYGELCPGVMATTYSRDVFGDRNPVVTAGKDGKCEFYFGGSSAAAAMASGLIALTLEANQNLTWRDVQHIIARSARFIDGRKPPYCRTNGAGLEFSDYMGFGLMDAFKMVNLAKSWKNVPKQRRCEIFSNYAKQLTRTNMHGEIFYEVDLSSWPTECREEGIHFLEHVQVRVNIQVWPRGDLLLSLESPSKTTSHLTRHRPFDRFRGVSTNLTDWVILTLRHWGENPQGIWRLKARLHHTRTRGPRWLRILGWSLILYGTTQDPLDGNSHVYNFTTNFKKPKLSPNKTGYIVQITTGRGSPRLKDDTKIQLIGDDGKTEIHSLTPSGNVPPSSSSQLYYLFDSLIGKFTQVDLTRGEAYNGYVYIKEIAVRQEGNNKWIVFPHKNYMWLNGRVLESIKEDIDECLRGNGGCSHGCVNTKGSYYCTCPRGYRLDYYTRKKCLDINECFRRNGGCSHECVNIPGSYYCTCRSGYRLYNGRWCTEINECYRGNGGCSHGCVNTQGSYYCTCPRGYRSDHTRRKCLDINECFRGNGGCSHGCVNIPGSYYCTCRNGFLLRHSWWCQDINECLRGKGGCSHECVNTPGSYHCTCLRGYQLHYKTCRDVNECNRGNGDCSHTCLNTDGSHRCTCPKGFELSLDQRTCMDLNECRKENGGCSHKCVNTDGSHKCTCPKGFELSLDQRTCMDLNECRKENGGCSHKCVNTDGSHKCTCPKGFELSLDQRTCMDLNECRKENGGCSHKCVNTDGSHKCTCPKGFELSFDQRTCMDLNECRKENGGCSHKCVNTDGSHKCTCPKGFELSLDQRTCMDLNECRKENGGCSHKCVNTDGSHKCTCPKGFELSLDQRTCKVVDDQQPVFRQNTRPKNCKDLESQDPSYSPNGEYRIFPMKECNISIKVYCHHDRRASVVPTEYITVTRNNIVEDWKGKTVFQKVRLDPKQMLIVRHDTRFANFSAKYERTVQHYGSAQTICTSNNVQTYGKVVVDLSGTGIRFKSEIPWEKPPATTIEYDLESGSYEITCEKCDGECKPESELFVSIVGC